MAPYRHHVQWINAFHLYRWRFQGKRREHQSQCAVNKFKYSNWQWVQRHDGRRSRLERRQIRFRHFNQHGQCVAFVHRAGCQLPDARSERHNCCQQRHRKHRNRWYSGQRRHMGRSFHQHHLRLCQQRNRHLHHHRHCVLHRDCYHRYPSWHLRHHTGTYRVFRYQLRLCHGRWRAHHQQSRVDGHAR